MPGRRPRAPTPSPPATQSDVAAAVNFARENNLRLVVKGGGHSYQGTSNAADSLLIWTREMNAITLHDSFVRGGLRGRGAAAGGHRRGGRAMAGQRYEAVTTRRGPLRPGRRLRDRRRRRPGAERRLRQLLEELRHGGREPARGRDRHRRRQGAHGQRLPESRPLLGAQGRRRRKPRRRDQGDAARRTRFPSTSERPRAASRRSRPAAFRRLIGEFVRFYRKALFNPHWGEQATFGTDNSLSLNGDAGTHVEGGRGGLDAVRRVRRGLARRLRMDRAARSSRRFRRATGGMPPTARRATRARS